MNRILAIAAFSLIVDAASAQSVYNNFKPLRFVPLRTIYNSNTTPPRYVKPSYTAPRYTQFNYRLPAKTQFNYRLPAKTQFNYRLPGRR